MRHRIILALILSAVMAVTVMAGDEPAPAAASPAPEKAIGLVRVGAVDPALADRVRAFVEENTAVRTRLLPAQEVAGGTLDEEGAAVSRLVGDDVFCLVAIVEPAEDIKPHGVLLPELRVAVVNAKPLKPADGDAERYARRLERGAMQGVGMLLGLEPCPNPQCALWQYSTDEELDAKGRNYCPPCLEKVQKAAREKGVTLIESSPFLVR